MVRGILGPLGACTTPLVLIAVGVVFSARGVFTRLPFFTVLLRMPLGLAIGLALVWLLGLEGLTAAVVMVCAVAPIGFNSVTLAAAAELDTEQAACALSLSIAVAMLSTTGLLLLVAHALNLSV
jgi:predicted permease